MTGVTKAPGHRRYPRDGLGAEDALGTGTGVPVGTGRGAQGGPHAVGPCEQRAGSLRRTSRWRRLSAIPGYDRPMRLPVAPIETARLTLRPFTPGDFDDLYAYQSRQDVARYLDWYPRDAAQARNALEHQCAETVLDAEGDWLTFAVVLRDTGRVIGEVGLELLSRRNPQGETGFVFNPEFQGRGLATEAAEAMLALGFDRFGWHRIIGRCDARNSASAGVLRRIGMRLEAHFVQNRFVKGRWCDEFVFAILDDEWSSTPARLQLVPGALQVEAAQHLVGGLGIRSRLRPRGVDLLPGGGEHLRAHAAQPPHPRHGLGTLILVVLGRLLVAERGQQRPLLNAQPVHQVVWNVLRGIDLAQSP